MKTEKQFLVSKDILTAVPEFLDSWYEQNNIDLKIASKLSVCSDEIVSNIVFYSNASSLTLQCDIADEQIIFTFIDNGKPFDPLTQTPDPDINLSAQERQIGGLGIFIVKKMMETAKYSRQNEKNIFTMTINRNAK